MHIDFGTGMNWVRRSEPVDLCCYAAAQEAYGKFLHCISSCSQAMDWIPQKISVCDSFVLRTVLAPECPDDTLHL